LARQGRIDWDPGQAIETDIGDAEPAKLSWTVNNARGGGAPTWNAGAVILDV